jgi:hypothetical protein
MMMEQDMGASDKSDRAVVNGAGQAVSALRASVPSASREPDHIALGTLDYRVSWPRPATPCDLMPLWAGEFRDHGDWVNFATKRLTGTFNKRSEVKAICVDALGRRCHDGGDMARARDEGAFPVRYFWECAPAQAIEARRAETQSGSVHESAVLEEDAPNG